jgi:hypothetical protein
MLDKGFFADGPEPLLWRPDLDHRRLRLQGMRESVVVEAAPFAFIGTALAVMIGTWIGVAVAVLVLALATIVAVSTYRRWGLECTRPGWARHRHDRGAGQWYYRPSDFTALPDDIRAQVDALFAALSVFDDPTVLAWLQDNDRLEVHRVAWALLDCLHSSLPGRAALARVSQDLATDDVVQLVRHQLVRVDTAIVASVRALCETSALVQDLAARITAPRRRAALHEDLRSLRLATPPAVAELRDDLRTRVRAVHDVLDLAGTTP